MKKAFMYVMVLCVGMFVFGCGEPAKVKPTTPKTGTTTPDTTKVPDKDKPKP